MTKDILSREWEALSAYLDGELSSKERSRLESRLETSVDLRAALDELRRTRAVLRSQPQVRAPRNFTISPQMVGISLERRTTVQLFPAMRLTAVLASVLFVFVLLGDLLWMGQRTAAPMLMAEPVTQMAQIEAESPPEDISEVVVEKAVEAGELAEPEVGEVEQFFDTADEPAAREPEIEMPVEEAEGYVFPSEEADITLPPQTSLAGAEPTKLPTAWPSIQPEEEIVLPDENLENRYLQAKQDYLDRRILRVIEVILLIMGVTTGFVALYLRPKQNI